ncbi:MAG: FMN-binding protein [Acidobacteriota bacterium]|nr:FMN-binding protein [Acidobacteriota bacterium]
MSLSSRMVIVLTSVGLISGALLSTVGILTNERIALNKQLEIENAIITVVQGTHTSEKIYEEKDLVVYGSKDENNQLIGFAVYASGTGFQDKIILMYGTNPTFTKIYRLTILEQKETPGLGAKITDKDAFLQFWENKDSSQPLTLRKPAARSPEELSPFEVNTITGATISSESVLNIVRLSLGRLMSLKKEGKLGNEK